MSVKIITVAFDPSAQGFDNEALDQFLAGKTIHHLQSEFFQQHGQAYWTLLIEYDALIPLNQQKKPSVQLTNTEQALLNTLQEWRRDKAKDQGLPVYVLATNKELEALVIKKPITQEALKTIAGFGEKKCQRHGSELLTIIQRYASQASSLDQEIKHTNADVSVKSPIESAASDNNPPENDASNSVRDKHGDK